MLLVEALNKSAMPGSDELFDKIATLFTLLDAGSLERHPFVSTALNWTGKGRPEDGMKLHQVLAIALWKEKNYSMSRYHFLRSSDGEGCAKMLIEFSVTRGYPSEFDLFITQAVLQYLCLRNKSTANRVFNIYMERHPSVETGPPFKHTPLLNFLWFLLLAVEKGKLAIFTVLCEQYQPSIRRDPCYNEYLDRIGQLFFGVPPPRRPTGGIFGNLLSSIMGGLDDDDGDDMDVSVPTTSERSAVASKRLITEDLD
ncbi:PREDICTED: Golgi to ER traffic protein 4 homolog isoform X2 [Priapulus caudatus]|nr:PREDICTED: Golgi to ER traffic protein 4 homolog isoform X2 [Priapulus caudatus]